MTIPSLKKARQFAGDAGRLREIMAVVFEGGFETLVDRAGLGGEVPLDCRLKHRRDCKCDHPEDGPCEMAHTLPAPVRLRLILEQLGPTFVKMGQVLSIRPDLIPVEFTEELKSLQDNAPAVPHEQLCEIIEAELGAPPEELFVHFDETPLAAASLGQVHMAHLEKPLPGMNGIKVAVKIQRPGIVEVIEKDLHILAYIAGLMEKTIPEVRNYRPANTVAEFAAWTRKELDFTVEGRNADEFRVNFAGDPQVKLPIICWDHTSPRVLTMEFVEGVRVDDEEGLVRVGADKIQLASQASDAILKQIFTDGFFHGDLHPGNLLVLPGNVLCMLDLGMVGRLRGEDRRLMIRYWINLVNGDFKRAFNYMLAMAAVDELSDVDGFRNAYLEIVNSWYGTTLEESSIAMTGFRIVMEAARYGVVVPSDQVLLNKAMVTAEGINLQLNPAFNMVEETQPFVKQLLQEEFSPQRLVKAVQASALDYMDVLEQLPDHLLNLYRRLEKGDFRLRLDDEQWDKLPTTIAGAGQKMAWGIVVAGLVVAGALALGQGPMLGEAPIPAAVLFLLALLLGWKLRG